MKWSYCTGNIANGTPPYSFERFCITCGETTHWLRAIVGGAEGRNPHTARGQRGVYVLEGPLVYRNI